MLTFLVKNPRYVLDVLTTLFQDQATATQGIWKPLLLVSYWCELHTIIYYHMSEKFREKNSAMQYKVGFRKPKEQKNSFQRVLLSEIRSVFGESCFEYNPDDWKYQKLEFNPSQKIQKINRVPDCNTDFTVSGFIWRVECILEPLRKCMEHRSATWVNIHPGVN